MASEFSKEQLERILSTVMGEDEGDHEQDMGELGEFVSTAYRAGFLTAAERYSSVVKHVKTCKECLEDVGEIFSMIILEELLRFEVDTSSLTE